LFPTRRLSTKVFPPSPYPPSFQPYLPHVFQASPTPYPIVFRPLPTTPYPLSFTTSCFHEFGRPNPGLSQIQDVSRESRRMSREKKRRLWEGDLKEVFKASAENISRNFTETTSHYPVPIVFQQGGDEEEQNWEKAKKREGQKYLHFEERKSLKSFRRGAGVAT